MGVRDNKDLVIYDRSSHVLKAVNKVFIHKGNMFISFFKTTFNLYQRFGFFSFTRRSYSFKKKKKVVLLKWVKKIMNF
jgi:ribosomal protein S19